MLAKKCNDMDTASLLIALLRASDIPARYVHGVIELPIDKVMNWVGGFTDVNSATGFIASGGTPILSIAQGGAISKVRMEHVWVEAYVDYIPSRGAVHITGDSWVPLDGSYKQYVYTEGIDIQAAVPFDAEAFAEQVEASATIDPVTGAVTGIDQTFIQTTMADYQTQIEDYVNATMPDATGADLIGSKTVAPNTSEFLPLSASYTITNTGTKYAETPDGLRHKITFSTTTYPHIGEDFSVTKSIPELAGKRITVGYNFASSADQQTADNFQSLFTAKPALIKLRASVMIDGVQIGQSEIKGLCDTVRFDMAFSSPYYHPEVETEDIVLGSIVSVVLNPNVITPNFVASRLPAIGAMGDAVISGTVNIDNIYTDAYMGTILEMIGLTYYFELDGNTTLDKQRSKIVQFRQPSRMLVSKGIELGYLYGVPFQAFEGGTVLDVDREVATTMSRDGNIDKRKSFILARGMNMSRLEHKIFRYFFNSEGISTMRILETAASSGIAIVTIDKNNVADILPQLQISSGVKEDIANLINAGSEITTPLGPVTIGTWYGTGYIALNPITLAGAYVIEGGAAGGKCGASIIAFLDTIPGFNAILGYLIEVWNAILYGQNTGNWGLAISGAIIGLLIQWLVATLATAFIFVGVAVWIMLLLWFLVEYWIMVEQDRAVNGTSPDNLFPPARDCT